VNIYVGNLSFKMTEGELQKLFEKYGKVTRVTIIKEKETDRSKGFGFVEMDESADSDKAIEELNGFSAKGRDLRVNKAKSKEEKSQERRKKR